MSERSDRPFLEARAVTLTYAGRAHPAVNGASLVVSSSAAIGIVGESGSGKTSFARVLVGALTPQAGEVLVDGKPWREVRRKDPRRRAVQMVFQDPYGALNPWMSARQSVAEVVRLWERVDRQGADDRAASLLREVGLPEDAGHRKPAALSGGQCQRVGIARALACAPRVIVADEPTSALDVGVQAQVLNVLAALRASRALAIVLVSHDLGVIQHFTDYALVMREGRVVESGATERIFSSPQHWYTRELVQEFARAATFARSCP